MNRFVSCLLALLMVSAAAIAADGLKVVDSATTKIKKTPKGSPIPAIEQPTYKSAITVVIPAPGVDPASFNASTAIEVKITDGSSSSDYEFKHTFGDDPKYTTGAKSVKITEFSQPGITFKQNILKTAQVKIGKDSITITIKEDFLSLYAQMYLNYGTLGVVQYPEGKGTASRSFTLTASVGTITKTFSGVTYNVNYSNKKVIVSEKEYWAGSAKGSASTE